MRNFTRFALSIGAAAALLAACGGSSPSIVAPGVLPQSRVSPAHADRSRSWMLPEAKSSDLLYVSSDGSNEVSVLQLPNGKLVGQLAGFNGPLGECTNAKGDVFIADFEASQIWEYAHGAKSPKAILSDPEYGPVGCSVDPTTGNLAVTNEIKITGTTGPGNVAIYQNASGDPTLYFDSSIYQFGFCAYDGSGNLYLGGSNPPSFAELPKGQTNFTALKLNEIVSGGSPMQWDGRYLAIVAGSPGSLIYRFKIKGSHGKAVGVLQLKGATYIEDFAIQGTSLYAPLYSQSEVGVFPYPHGGKVTNTFFGFGYPVAAAVSLRQADNAALPVNDVPEVVRTHHRTFEYKGRQQTFTVPPNVTQIKVRALGGNGSSQYGEAFGSGARVSAVIPVTPGEKLLVFVGGNASGITGGYNGGAAGGEETGFGGTGGGGGGGGASDVRRGTSLDDRIVIAAGGGGQGGEGGGAGGRGGRGGGKHGQNGGEGAHSYYACNGAGGDGAAQSAGGDGGTGSDCGYTGGKTGGSGRLGAGGTGGDGGNKGVGQGAGAGGGGGGGYYGGGGGGGGADNRGMFGMGGGGGGGSSYVESTATHVRFWPGWSRPHAGGLVTFEW